MSGKRVALLVGCGEYEDRSFSSLPMAGQDIAALARVLNNPDIGDFTVTTLLGEPSGAVRVQIEHFFANRKPDDLLLLYFSCHGDLDSGRYLHFIANDTRKQLLDSTGISARWVKERMDRSRSQRILLLLDCCYSGAFARGLVPRGVGAKEVLDQLSGRGRVVITASSKTEFAYESKFTNAVVHGLESGAADVDGDGQVSVYELYQYVYEQVRQTTQGQTPTMSADDMRGQFYLAKNAHAPLPLPDILEEALKSKITRERRWAIEGLRHLLAGDHPGGQKRTAREALIKLRDGDTDAGVRAAAARTLRDIAAEKHLGHWWVKVSVAAAVVLLGLAAMVWIPSQFHPAAAPVPCPVRTKTADGVLSMGTLLPRTGQYIYSGPAMDAGVHLAIRDINDAGGIPGIAVKFDEANQRDEGDPSDGTGVESTDALLADGVDVIVGPSTSAVAAKVIDKAACAGVIMFSPANTAPMFSTHPDRGLYFSAMPTTEVEGSILGKLIVDDGNSTIVMLSRDDPYANPLREKIGKVIQGSGGRVLDSFHYDPNALDSTKVVQRIKAKNPGAILLIGLTDIDRILVDMIWDGLGPKNKRVYNPNLTNTLASVISPRDPSVLAGMRGTLPYDGGEAFVKRLKEVNPTLQDTAYGAQSYDTVVITTLAAAIAGTDAPAAVAKAIIAVTKSGGEKCIRFAACMALVKDHKDIDYQGPSGPLEFTDAGRPSSATYVVYEIQADGTLKPLTPPQN